MTARKKKKQVKKKMDAHLPLTDCEKIWCIKYYGRFRLGFYISTLNLNNITINLKDGITEVVKGLIPVLKNLAETIKSSELYNELYNKELNE